jgi:hypothetical protein
MGNGERQLKQRRTVLSGVVTPFSSPEPQPLEPEHSAARRRPRTIQQTVYLTPAVHDQVNRALRIRIEAIEKRVKPPEPWFVIHSFDESDEELDARLRELRLEHSLTPSSALHIVLVRFKDHEEQGK